MAIRRGEAWGQPEPLPEGAPVVSTDRELAALLRQHRQGQEPTAPVVGLLGGDLCATLGGRGDRASLGRPDAHTLPCDLGIVRWDDGEDVFVAHAFAAAWRGSGAWFAAMNASWAGARNVAPKAHPGDGRLDLLITDLSPLDRVKAYRRLQHGAHVPHPSIVTHRVKAFTHEFDRRVRLSVDGEPAGRTRRVQVEIVPDAFSVVV